MFTRFFSRPKSPSSVRVEPQLQPVVAHVVQETDEWSSDIRYPPFDQGIPVVDPLSILRSQEELISRIQRAAGTSEADFQKFYLPVISALARYTHLLPATVAEYHRGAGGLFRLSLEIAFHSLQCANASLFPVSGAEQRYHMQPRWAFATFVAGLLSQLYRPINGMVVVDDNDQQWTPITAPLYDWLKSRGAKRYFIRFLDLRHNQGTTGTVSYVINHIVSNDSLNYLGERNNLIIPVFTAAIGGVERIVDNPIARIVSPTATRVMQEDLSRSSTNYGNYTLGVHLEPHLIDSMRRLIKDGAWSINVEGGCLWHGVDGLYIAWQEAASDIVRKLRSEQFAGVPQDPDTLADIMLEAGALERNGSERYWTIILPSGALVESAVKLKDPSLILPPHLGSNTPNIHLTTGHPSSKKSVRQHTDSGADHLTQVSCESQSSLPFESASTPPKQPETVCVTKSEAPALKKPALVMVTAHAPTDKPVSGSSGSDVESTYLINSLSDDARFLVSQLLTSYTSDDCNRDHFRWLEHGLGILDDELTSHGGKTLEMLNELSAKKWLWIDQLKPMRKLHSVMDHGNQQQFMIIRPEIASALGFGDSSC